jgi:hypothetical protein
MRTHRVRASAIPQVRAALKARQITLYRADELAKLPASEQEIAVAQRVNRSLLRTEGQAIAAAVIRKVLKRGSKVDLGEIASAIHDAIALATPLT